MQEDVQAFKDFEDLCYRFEKKINDLEFTRVIAIQSAPQVRMLQNNDREMLDKLQSSIANTIPLWRNQLVLSLGIEHTRRSLDAQNTLADKTNELLMKNSETLKMAMGLIRGNKILLLDEITSALDSLTEEKLVENLKTLLDDGYTIISISHKLEFLKYSDIIYTISDGKVVNIERN